MSVVDIIVKAGSLILTLLMLYAIFAVIYAVYLYFSPNTTRPTSGWYWPSFLNAITGAGPQTFSVVASNVAVGNDILGTISNATPTTCMSNCNVTKNCIGFIINTDGTTGNANVCTTFTTLSGLVPAPNANTYIVSGNEPSFVYDIFPNLNIPLPSKIPAYTSKATGSSFGVAKNIMDCAANCSANSTCNGFSISSTSLCAQSNAVTLTTTLAAVAGTTTCIADSSYTPQTIGAPYATSGILP